MAGVADIVNTAQRRLLYCKEAGEESWYGTWAEVQFTVSRTTPFVTFDASVARIEYADICTKPVTVNNQFVEFLRFGNGRMPKLFRNDRCGCFAPEVYTRNQTPTLVDIGPTPQFIRAYTSDATDIGKRAMIQGLDNNGAVVLSQDGLQRAQGNFQTLANPFVQWPMQFSQVTGIQKDVTNSPVQFFMVDPTTGNQVLIANMQPYEQTAWYRRYFFNKLPFNCCSFIGPNPCTPTQPAESVLVNAIVKLEFVPVVYDTDYCLIQNLEALKEEVKAVRYSNMDDESAKKQGAEHHKNAVRFLNGELAHYYGIDNPAINVAVFGSARLERQAIGTML